MQRESQVGQTFSRAWRVLLPVALIGMAVLLIAASQPATRVKDFSVPQYDDPPNETRMKSLLTGAEAEPQPGGLIQIKTLKLLTFDEKGAPEMIVQAPHCTFDPTQRTVSSPGRLQAQSTDGKFYLEGVGFCFQQTNSLLTISNRVQGRVQGGGALNSFFQ